MKTKNLLLSTVAAGSLFLISCGGSPENTNDATADTAVPEPEVIETVEHTVDLSNSSVSWAGEMMGMYKHNGTVNISEASLSTAGDKVVGGNFTVDLSTITPLDDNYKADEEGHTKEDLVGHLSSPDFFDVANFGTATFEVTGSSEDGNSISGNLTIRGISNEETVEDVTNSDGAVSGTLTFDRTKYDVSFSHPMKEMVLSNDIVLNISLKVAE
ncbi:MAG: YceI family protein [Flavobacteriales bacterium]|nr:YceI family protein [Flavobacteriales bacterium]